jgi:Tol biopolymer transport system component
LILLTWDDRPREDERMRRGSVFPFLAFAVIAALLVPSAAQAQYFGRNQVRYRTFDFQVLKTEHFDIYYYPEEREAVEQTAPMAERWYARLSRLFGHTFVTRQPIVLYGSHPEFEQTNILGGAPGEGTGGVTEAIKRRVVLPFAGPLAETDHVLGHELVHAFQFDITGQDGSASGGMPGAVRLPLWFIEGMAEYMSLGPLDPHTAMWMRDAAKREKLPKISQLNSSKYFPYRYGQAFWAYVGGRFGDHVIGDVLKIAGKRGDAEKALEEVLGVKIDDLSKDWQKAIQSAYQPLMASKHSPSDYGRALINEANGGGELNIAPKLSPDGKQVVFLSERGLFAVDMYVADAQTGKVERTIVKTAVDPHFESLEFINSAGAWDAAGRRFVFGAIRNGRPVLSFLDVARGHIDREIPLPDLGEVQSPTWSPDGRYVAFSAITGGLTDLYIYDLQAGSLRRMTTDAYADLQPAWSPDGRSIAFVTDRFSTAVEMTEGRAYRLALMDPGTGEIKELHSFEEGKNIDPQWAADSRSLYYLSDRNGITNVYRLELDSGRQFQVTDLLTGVSGITPLSPALSVAGSRLAFGAYEDGKYAIYTMDDARAQAGIAVEGAVDRVDAAMLPPRDRRAAEVLSLRGDPSFGLPRQGTFASGPYKSHLSLDYLGQPSVAVGSGPFGTYVGGGVSMFFSDMLGNHSVGAILQVNGSFADFGGIVAYVNRKRRWDWGVDIEQIPYVTGSFGQGTDTVNGQPAFVQQQLLFREINRAVSTFVAYPFSRSRRIELGAGFRNISFQQTLETQAFSLSTGQLLVHDKQNLPAPGSLSLGEGTAALVGDTSLFGATSPILGQRYRFEVSPTLGAVNFTGILADYRRYIMPVRPYTFALRLIHYGRYGSGGEDNRLQPLYIGYPNLVRGYDVNSFSASECGNGNGNACPVFDQLLGSRVAVANLELRVPPFGAFGGKGLYGPVPIELLGFADAGVAWSKGDSVKFDLSGADGSLTTRRPVRSVGVGARVNVFGYAILEVDYAKPLDRPLKNWVWLFNLSPGF